MPGVLVFGEVKDGNLKKASRESLSIGRLEWVDGKLRARRPVYSGKAFDTVEVVSTPAIATCRPNACPAEESGGGPAQIIEVAFQPGASKARVLETKVPEAGELSIAEADIIVSG